MNYPHPASIASWQAVESATEGLCVVPWLALRRGYCGREKRYWEPGERIGWLARYNGGPICGGACPLEVAASVLEGEAWEGVEDE